jgi:hypothetical protein
MSYNQYFFNQKIKLTKKLKKKIDSNDKAHINDAIIKSIRKFKENNRRIFYSSRDNSIDYKLENNKFLFLLTKTSEYLITNGNLIFYSQEKDLNKITKSFKKNNISIKNIIPADYAIISSENFIDFPYAKERINEINSALELKYSNKQFEKYKFSFNEISNQGIKRTVVNAEGYTPIIKDLETQLILLFENEQLNDLKQINNIQYKKSPYDKPQK